MAEQVEIRVDRERLGELVTVDEFIGLQDGDVRTIRDVLGRFVWDGERYLEAGEGKKVVGGMTLNQLIEAGRSFAGKAQSAAVPLASGTT